jgi:hypothetical protein
MTSPRSRQRGQETLQAILAVSFMLLPVLFGIVEMGGLVHLWIGQQSAAAAGARIAGEQGQDDALVRQRIQLELQAAGLDPSRIQVSVSPPWVHWGQPITVQLRSHRHIAIPFLFSRDLVLTSAYVARGEVNH